MAGVKLDTSIRGDNSSISQEDAVTELASYSALSAPPSRAVIKQKSIHIPRTSVPQKTIQLQLQPVVRLLHAAKL